MLLLLLQLSSCHVRRAVADGAVGLVGDGRGEQ